MRPRRAAADRAILRAALARFEARGWEGLNVDDVAAQAGVAKTTVYRRWPSKAALLAAAAAPLYQLPAAPPDTGRLRGDLVELVERTRAALLGRPGRILQRLVIAAQAHAEIAEPLRASLFERRRLFYQVLNRAIARGEVRPGVDQDLVVNLLTGPFWVRALVMPAPAPPALVAEVVDAVLDGIRRR